MEGRGMNSSVPGKRQLAKFRGYGSGPSGFYKMRQNFFVNSETIINNNIYLTAIGLSPGGSGFEHIYKYLTLCY